MIDASADTGWIDRVRGQARLVTSRHSAIALAAAAIEAFQDEKEVARQRLLVTANGGRPQVQHENGRPLDLKLRGAGYRVSVARIGQKRFRVGISVGGGVHPADVEIERFDSHSGQITANGQRYRLVTGTTHAPVHLVEIDGVAHRVRRDEGGVVRSPAPALVVATPVSAGDEVEVNAPILVLESMKMETVLRSPFRARVREPPVSVGSQVEAGAALLRLEPLAGEGGQAEAAGTGGTAEIELPAEPAAASAANRAERDRQDLRSLLLVQRAGLPETFRVADRMQLEQLREFNLTRLPSADEEVYLFKYVAQANPADERLVAMAQVRDLTPSARG